MSDVSGTIATPFSSSKQEKERFERPDSVLRFTQILSRENWAVLGRKRDETRIYSAICFPGWDQG
jgi:hypothetical protein